MLSCRIYPILQRPARHVLRGRRVGPNQTSRHHRSWGRPVMAPLSATGPGTSGTWGFHNVPRRDFDALPMQENRHEIEGCRIWWSKRMQRTFAGRKVAVVWMTEEPPSIFEGLRHD